MKSPFARLLAASFFIPIGLLVLNTLHANQLATLSIDRHFFMNWLYMAAPQLILGVSTFVLPSLLGGGIVTLVVLDGLLVCFQLWIWFVVSPRDGADAWALYVPLWIAILVTAFIYARVRPSRDRKL
jgi:hypothetical protein